jgi:CBS domain-containing protein
MRTPLGTILASKGGAVFSVPPNATVAAAVELLNQKGIGSVLVMEGEQLVGIFTERDVLRKVVSRGADPRTTRVSEVMTGEVVAVRPSATVEDAMSVISERRFRHLPVVDHGRVLGMVSIGDLNHWLIRNRESHIEQLVEYISGKYPG